MGLSALFSGSTLRLSACVLCASGSANALCTPCALDLPRVETACPRCARPMPFAEVCGRCLRKPPAFDAAFAVFAYVYPMDILLTRAKYNSDFATLRFLSGALAEMLASQSAPKVQNTRFDAIVPVPLSPARQRERGYNQAAMLARNPSAQLAAPILADLVRTRETEKQTELTFKARLKNVRGAFTAAALDRPLAGKHVLLIDDVMTTGATLNEAAIALKEAGAARVTVAVVARAVSRK